LPEAAAAPPRRSLSRTERAQLLDLLRAVVTRGTGRGAALPGTPVYGKTGTSQDYRDAYFIGFTVDLVVGVWVGNDDNTPMAGVTGGALPAQIWRAFAGYALRPKGAVVQARPAAREPVMSGPMRAEPAEEAPPAQTPGPPPLQTPAIAPAPAVEASPAAN
jgi:penicillin-binding protein 1A